MKTRRSRGQSVVEFALTLPIFLWLVIGIFDVGRAVVSHSLLANCAREGTRAGAGPATADATIIAAVNSQSLLLGSFPSVDSSVTITPSSQNQRTSGSNLTVSLSYTFTPTVTTMMSNVLGNFKSLTTINMSASSTMVIE